MTKQSKLEKDFFLTDEEYYRKRANLIEELKQCAIDLNYTPNLNSVYEYEKELRQNPTSLAPKNFKKVHSYSINIQNPVDENIPKKTAVYHELSHVLWDSFVGGAIVILRDWADLTTSRLLTKYGMVNNIPVHLAPNLEALKQSLHSFVKEVYMNCFNSLEDQRIESLTQNVWLATRGMFNVATTNCGKQMTKDNMRTPADHILAARFHRPELTTKEWRDAVHRVEGTGMTGAIAVMSEVKELIDKHIEDNLKQQLKNAQDNIKRGGCIPTPVNIVNQYIEKQTGTNSVKGQAKEYSLRVKRYEEAIKQSNRSPEEKKEMAVKIEKYKKYAVTKRTKPKTEGEKKIEESAKAIEQQQTEVNKCATNIGGSLAQEKSARKAKIAGHVSGGSKSIGTSGLNKNSIARAKKSTVEEAKQAGTKELNRMLSKIYGQAIPTEPAYVIEGVNREHRKPQINQEIARQLARTFNKIQQTKRTAITEHGTEVDIEAVLQAQAKGFGDYMIDDVKYRGLTIYISVDGSGSMSYLGHMKNAQDLIATMFKAVERTPQVKMLANVWSSDTQGQVGITTIKTTEQCKSIGMSAGHSYMYTPTHEAIRYTAKQLSGVSGKKLMILLTDGHPQYHMNGKSLDNETLVQMAIREQRKAQKIVHSMVCININAGEPTAKSNLKRIFKKDYVEFNGMERAKIFVMKNFKQAVYSALRK